LVPPNQLIPGQAFSSAALKTYEMSVFLIDEWSLELMQAQFPDSRLTAFLAKDARTAQCVVIRVPANGNNAHATVIRDDSPGQRPSSGNIARIQKAARWVDAIG
jgi:hypothetical protein